jgi:hypothetical protein
MEMETKANDVAFPAERIIHDSDGNEIGRTTESGLTKREYFAAMAMQGLISNELTIQGPDGLSIDAVKYADALIEQLNRRKAEG